MKVSTHELVGLFKPIRVEIDLHSAAEMDVIADMLRRARNRVMNAGELHLIEQLLPCFTRL